jgi:Rho termination factor, N-terminal domain
MATSKQVAAAKRNVVKAQEAARRKRTIAHLRPETRSALVAEAQKGRRRGDRPGHALEDRNREQLYDVARDLGIRGRSKMGKAELIRAIRAARGG